MNKQDMMKIQTCVLRVNIHCEGCKHKVKKQLQKVEGVYKVSVDVDQGKVTVSGNVDPLLLVKKLEKVGKHAELWGPPKGSLPFLNNSQNKNIQFDGIKNGKALKGGFQVLQQTQMNPNKGVRDEKLMGKDQKSVKFKLPEESEDDSDEFDDDEFEDESDEGFEANEPPMKVAPVGHGQQAKKADSKGHVKGNNGEKGWKGKKGGGINMLFKGILGKAGGKNGNGGKNSNKGENKKEDGSKESKKNGGFPVGDWAVNGKEAAKNGGGKGTDGWSKKGGGGFDGGTKLEGKQKGFDEMKGKHKGGGGRNMDMMGQMGSFPAAQRLPAAPVMNGGRFQGMGPGNLYSQQSMAQMMMNQQRGNGQDGYNQWAYIRPHPPMGYGPPPPMGYGPPPPMGYGPPPPMGYGQHPAMGYGRPPPATDQYTHMFNDENTDSCSIM